MHYQSYRKPYSSELVARIINTALLCIHILLLVLFLILHVYVMVFVNVASILIYLSSFWVIKKLLYNVYVKIVYIEIWMHMMIATAMMGWEFGFQLYCFPLVPVMFYSFYTSTEPKKSRAEPIVLSLTSAIVFIIARYYTHFFPAVYLLTDENITLTIFSVNAAIVFAFLFGYMLTYTKTVIYSEYALRDMADFDELTGLYNRHRMRHFLNQAGSEAKACSRLLCVAIVDIDNFKQINDTYGHIIGDFVLRKVSDILKNLSPAAVKVSRWGGEEFLLLNFYSKNAETYYTDIEVVRKAIANSPLLYNNIEIPVTVTAGLALYDLKGSVDDTIREADDNLYRGKNQGKNCVFHLASINSPFSRS